MQTILLAFAFVCEVLAAFGVGAPRLNLVAAGLAFWLASIIFAAVNHLH